MQGYRWQSTLHRVVCEGGNAGPRYSLPVFFQPHEHVSIDTISIDTVRKPAVGDGISTTDNSEDQQSVRTVGDFMQLWSASQGEGNAQSIATKLAPKHIRAAQQDAYIAPHAACTYSASL